MRLVRALVVAVAVAAVALAVGASASANSSDLAFRPAGAHGPLVRYDLQGSRRFALPAGMLSADGSVFANVTLRKLTLFDAASGHAVRDASVPTGSRVEAVSATGRWIVTRHGRAVRVVDGTSGRTRTTLVLPRAYDVDTVSADGSSLFLIHHRGGVRYAVVRYDLVDHRLLRKELVQKGGDEKMAGTAAGVVPAPDGLWQYTLYRHDAEHTAFVHALELVHRYTVCLDLPGHGTTAELRSWSLALYPEGRRLFAANPALGLVATFGELLGKPQVLRFPAARTAATGAAAASPDGRRLAFSAGSRVWIADLGTRSVRGPYDAGAAVRGLVFAQRLYAARADGKLALFQPATGRRVG